MPYVVGGSWHRLCSDSAHLGCWQETPHPYDSQALQFYIKKAPAHQRLDFSEVVHSSVVQLFIYYLVVNLWNWYMWGKSQKMFRAHWRNLYSKKGGFGRLLLSISRSDAEQIGAVLILASHWMLPSYIRKNGGKDSYHTVYNTINTLPTIVFNIPPTYGRKVIVIPPTLSVQTSSVYNRYNINNNYNHLPCCDVQRTREKIILSNTVM